MSKQKLSDGSDSESNDFDPNKDPITKIEIKFLKSKEIKIHDNEPLGSGYHSVVYGGEFLKNLVVEYKGLNKKNIRLELGVGSMCAVKIIRFGRFEDKEKNAAKEEIETLQEISHPNVVRLYKWCWLEKEDKSGCCFIVLEKADLGHLHNFLLKQQFDETILKRICLEAIRAVEALHQVKRAHRDITLKNFLVFSKNPDGFVVKMIDFEEAHKVNDEEVLRKDQLDDLHQLGCMFEKIQAFFKELNEKSKESMNLMMELAKGGQKHEEEVSSLDLINQLLNHDWFR